MKKCLGLLIACVILTACSKPSPVVTSPDGRIAVEICRQGDSIMYNATVDGKPLMVNSLLGFDAVGLVPSANAKMSIATSSHDETWHSVWGENKTHRDHHNEMAYTLTDSRLELTIRVRCFDDGFAFRYEWVVQNADTLVIADELTEFNFATDGKTWSIPANFETYELNYRELPLDSVENANTPFTFMTSADTIFGSIHEAALYDYPEMTLERTSPRRFKANLAPLPDGVKAYLPSRFATPWRTVQISREAVGLINSSMILNLNEPSRIDDTSWIRPQKYVGIWWGMHLGTMTWVMGPRHGATTENAFRYIDFAAENNLQGVLFEGWNRGWETWGGDQRFDYAEAYPDFNIDSIAAYAHSKNIELWAHNETGGNIPDYESQIEAAFARYKSLGIHTVKTGYAGGFKGGQFHHSQFGVRHYQKVVETAARYQIMLDVHEPIKDTGIRRTWPNMMTREGARGMEWNAWSEGNTADYLTVLPFVRLLSGPMDYTPGIFDINYERAKSDPGRIEWNGPNGHCRIKTTLARQIANWVIIYSPLQMGADLIENYQGRDEFQFFRDFNADCDSSQALSGEIGKYIVVMRRAGDRYFVGAGTNSDARDVKVALSFLELGVVYDTAIYGDGDTPEQCVITHREVTSVDTLTIPMAASGGCAISFIPKIRR